MLRWGLQRGWIVIPKSSSAARMTENASVLSPDAFTLSDEDMAALNDMDENLVTGWDPTVGV